MNNFEEMCEEMRKKVKVIIDDNTNIFAWEDFGGEGNACWNPHVFGSISDRKEDALALASTKVVIPYGGPEHFLLSANISKQLGNKYITYPWLIQAVAYILNGVSLEELRNLIVFHKEFNLEYYKRRTNA